MNTGAIEQEADGVGSFALSVAEGFHELLQLCGALDLEEDLIVVVGDFDVEMFDAAGSTFWLLRRAGASVLVGSRHLGWDAR